MFNIVIFGKPGSGKGTQADFLKDKYVNRDDVLRHFLIVQRTTHMDKKYN